MHHLSYIQRILYSRLQLILQESSVVRVSRNGVFVREFRLDPGQCRQPHVAVLLAVHAGADPAHLEEALASMRAQTYANVRLFVYCDGPLAIAHEVMLARHLRCEAGWDRLVRGERPAGLQVSAGFGPLLERARSGSCNPTEALFRQG